MAPQPKIFDRYDTHVMQTFFQEPWNKTHRISPSPLPKNDLPSSISFVHHINGLINWCNSLFFWMTETMEVWRPGWLPGWLAARMTKAKGSRDPGRLFSEDELSHTCGPRRGIYVTHLQVLLGPIFLLEKNIKKTSMGTLRLAWSNNKKRKHSKNKQWSFERMRRVLQGTKRVSVSTHDRKKIHSLKLTANAPENRPKPNMKVVFQPSILRGYRMLVSGRVVHIHF